MCAKPVVGESLRMNEPLFLSIVPARHSAALESYFRDVAIKLASSPRIDYVTSYQK